MTATTKGQQVKTRTPIEVDTRYSTTVDELTDAWSFVMEHIDKIGPHPSIRIYPCWGVDRDEALEEPDDQVHFHAVVEGAVEMKTSDEKKGSDA